MIKNDRLRFRALTVNGETVEGNASYLSRKNKYIPKGYYISNSAGMPFAYSIRPETLRQCTGREDKTGKLLFEGDIVKGICSKNPRNVCAGLQQSNKLGKELIGYIRYSASYCQFYFTTDDITYLNLLVGLKDIEIIGNKFENKHLLKC